MAKRIGRSLLVLILASTFSQLFGQTTGIPPFSTIVSDNSYESDNLDNFNILLNIPVRNKMGADLPFNFVLGKNFQLFYASNNGPASWYLADAGGFREEFSDVTGYFTHTLNQVYCPGYPNIQKITNQYLNWTFTDQTGAVHPFPVVADTAQCYSETLSGTASDQSGYYLTITNPSTNPPTAVIYDSKGNYQATTGLTTNTTSPNGNTIEATLNGATMTWTDTLGQTVLTRTTTTNGNTTTAHYGWTDANSNPQEVDVISTNLTWQTNFGCGSSVLPDQSPTTISLPTQITFPDGSQMSFGYEPTPGNPTNTTGRLAAITLPTGGQITYTYSGGSNGINCTYARPATITRTFGGSPITYSFSWTGWPTTSTTITDNSSPIKNDTVYQFYNGFLTQRISYQGPASNNIALDSMVACYNAHSNQHGNAVSCTANPAPPFTQIDHWHIVPGLSTPSLTSEFFSSNNSSPTEVKRYDFGTTAPVLVSDTVNEYGTYNPSTNSCAAPSQVYQVLLCRTTIKNGAGQQVAQSRSAYDSAGNLLQQGQWVNGTSYLSTKATYTANGAVATTTDTNGTTTTISNTSCNSRLATSQSSTAVSWSTSKVWDCNGAVTTSTKDANGQVTTYDYLDPFWRLVSTIDPTNAELFNYYNPFLTGSSDGNTYVDSSICISGCSPNIADTLTYLDPFGRISEIQHEQDALSANYDTVEYTYDSNGRPYSTSVPCVATNGPGSTCSSAVTTQTYDPLGRPLIETDGGGGTLTHTYTGRDVRVVASSPSLSRQYEYDGLDRLISICEISSSLPGVGTCGQDTARTGYWTRYQYDALGRLTGVCQNTSQPYSVNCIATPSSGQQTRTFSYDGFGRITSESNPESGLKQYFYDSAPSSPGVSCPGPFNGDLVKVYDSNGNTTCFAYDGLHRVVSATYSGPNSNGVNKYFVYDAATVNGAAMQNTKAQLAEAYTATSQNGTKMTDEGFSYSPRGELTDVYESTPHSGGYYHTTASYFENRVIKTLSGIPGQNGFTFGVDSEGRRATAKQGSTNLVSSTTFNAANQPLIITLGQGDTDTYQYDPNTGRMTNYNFTVGATPKSMIGALTWNTNGSLSKLAITDGFNSGGTQTCKYGDPANNIAGYDDLGRLIKVDCGASTWQQNFSYDAFGNLTKSVPTGGTGIAWIPGYNAANNRYTLSGTSYDADGDVLKDTFHTYTWSADAHPLTIDSSACGTNGTCLTYDALGRMVEKNVSGTYTEVLYGPIGKLAIMNGQSLVNAYVPLPGDATLNLSPGYTYLWHKDWLGSVRLSSALFGRAANYDRAFAPFGETYNNFGSTANNDFTGDTQDTVAGTYDTPGRELNATQGRWLLPDPAGLQAVDATNPQSWNRYAYGLNNPLSNVDPSGFECVWEDGSFDANDDPQTGDPFGCQNMGGTWVELGQGGNWSDQPNAANATLVASIQAGKVNSVTILGLDGQYYSTLYDSSGQTIETITPWGDTGYSYGSDSTTDTNNGGIINDVANWFRNAKLVGVGGSFWIPLNPRYPVGASPGANIVSNGQNEHACLSLLSGGVGVKSPGGSIGVLYGDPSKAFDIIQGASLTINVNFPIPLLGNIGGQIITSSAGTLAGATFGSPGASVQVSYSWPCE
jgi:RHS repeat-associated protein